MAFIRKLFIWAIVANLAALVVAYFAAHIYGKHMIEQQFVRLQPMQTTVVYDQFDEPAVALYRENRQLVSLNEVPERLRKAFIAIEDERFEHHIGVDIRATGRALFQDLMHMEWVEGGSTITQQLVKNVYLTSEKTVTRKMSEWAIAMALENRFSKDEILEMYLNRIYFGHGTYGIKAAAYYYFGKQNLHELELWEMATLAAIPKSPSAYNPIDRPEASFQRRSLVLAAMFAQGWITEDEAIAAAQIEYEEPDRELLANYNKYIDFLLHEMSEQTGLDAEAIYTGGYHIYTTMDVKAQQAVEAVFRDDTYFPEPGPENEAQGAMVIIDHATGGVVATIGGRDQVMRGFNRTLAPRQPGSVMKPLAVYAPALETGNWHASSMLVDEQMSFAGYEPSNVDHRYAGQVSMTVAIQDSKNVPAVWLLEKIGLDESFRYLEQMNIQLTEEDRHLSLALGGMQSGVTPLQLAAAYAVFARDGTYVKPFAIRYITGPDGEVIYKHESISQPVFSERTAEKMTDMLQKVVQQGTGQHARLNRPVAGKTGSTQTGIANVASGYRDAWFVGYTSDYTAAVWVGFDRTDEQHYIRGSSSAPARIFKAVMEELK